jgi:hypothetical protein
LYAIAPGLWEGGFRTKRRVFKEDAMKLGCETEDRVAIFGLVRL